MAETRRWVCGLVAAAPSSTHSHTRTRLLLTFTLTDTLVHTQAGMHTHLHAGLCPLLTSGFLGPPTWAPSTSTLCCPGSRIPNFTVLVSGTPPWGQRQCPFSESGTFVQLLMKAHRSASTGESQERVNQGA